MYLNNLAIKADIKTLLKTFRSILNFLGRRSWIKEMFKNCTPCFIVRNRTIAREYNVWWWMAAATPVLTDTRYIKGSVVGKAIRMINRDKGIMMYNNICWHFTYLIVECPLRRLNQMDVKWIAFSRVKTRQSNYIERYIGFKNICYCSIFLQLISIIRINYFKLNI